MALAGGAGALVLGALGYRAWDRGVFGGADDAFKPWRKWDGQADEGIRRPLHAAILAANPHDSQPWAFTAQRDSITVLADRSRDLGSFDPFRREMHLGLGCATENIVLAAQAHGFAATATAIPGRLTPSPPQTFVPAVQIGLTPAPPLAGPLYRAIPKRHTNRFAYLPDHKIEAETLARLAATAASRDVRVILLTDAGARRDLSALIVEATAQIIADPEMSADSADWLRTGRAEILDRRDGICLDNAGLSPLTLLAAKMLPDQSQATADQAWLAMTKDTQLPTAPVLGLILVRDRFDCAQAIDAGRTWQRLHLAATALGLAAQPVNQPVEMADRNRAEPRLDHFMPALQHLARQDGFEATFAFRLGYSDVVAPPSPRRPLDEAMRD